MNTKNIRWVVLMAGVLLQTAIGGIYAWSAFVPSLVEHHGFSRAQTGLLFGVQVIIFTITTLPAGKLLQKRGPRLTAAIGAVLFGLGYVLASFAGSSFAGLLLSLGVVTGIGIGMVYVCPLTTGMKWFPRNKGMVTGVAVAGFGAGAIALSAVAEYL
ncbi:MAG: MFS transporter, partial [Fibrobacterota bacterium]